MDKTKAVNNASFCFSANMLKILLNMDLITEKEYDKIIAISYEHYCKN